MFKDRVEAGSKLGELLQPYTIFNPVVLGLARGGMIVAREVARALGAELDVLVVRKIGAPAYPELAIGAVAPEVLYLDTEVAASLGVSRDELRRLAEVQRSEMQRREKLYRTGGFPINLRGRVVIVVDDGLATGATATAAVRSVRLQGAARVIFASPVCASSSAEALLNEADHVACLLVPRDFQAVGNHYQRFEQTTDAEVLSCLHKPATASCPTFLRVSHDTHPDHQTPARSRPDSTAGKS